jgi:hypothetical protein
MIELVSNGDEESVRGIMSTANRENTCRLVTSTLSVTIVIAAANRDIMIY